MAGQEVHELSEYHAYGDGGSLLSGSPVKPAAAGALLGAGGAPLDGGGVDAARLALHALPEPPPGKSTLDARDVIPGMNPRPFGCAVALVTALLPPYLGRHPALAAVPAAVLIAVAAAVLRGALADSGSAGLGYTATHAALLGVSYACVAIAMLAHLSECRYSPALSGDVGGGDCVWYEEAYLSYAGVVFWQWCFVALMMGFSILSFGDDSYAQEQDAVVLRLLADAAPLAPPMINWVVAEVEKDIERWRAFYGSSEGTWQRRHGLGPRGITGGFIFGTVLMLLQWTADGAAHSHGYGLERWGAGALDWNETQSGPTPGISEGWKWLSLVNAFVCFCLPCVCIMATFDLIIRAYKRNHVTVRFLSLVLRQWLERDVLDVQLLEAWWHARQFLLTRRLRLSYQQLSGFPAACLVFFLALSVVQFYTIVVRQKYTNPLNLVLMAFVAIVVLGVLGQATATYVEQQRHALLLRTLRLQWRVRVARVELPDGFAARGAAPAPGAKGPWQWGSHEMVPPQDPFSIVCGQMAELIEQEKQGVPKVLGLPCMPGVLRVIGGYVITAGGLLVSQLGVAG